ncbi:hypothetical protein BJF90_34755 [Pseudonocardia sp. CNS-004]|nr:hypothetical protein BJF90_34755 [Pseudonocardia sp. CNS-004]
MPDTTRHAPVTGGVTEPAYADPGWVRAAFGAITAAGDGLLVGVAPTARNQRRQRSPPPPDAPPDPATARCRDEVTSKAR